MLDAVDLDIFHTASGKNPASAGGVWLVGHGVGSERDQTRLSADS